MTTQKFVSPIAALRRRGFTLLEILIVVAIIGFLAAGALSTFGSTTPKARAKSNANNLVNTQADIDRFTSEYGSVPSYWFATTGPEKVLSGAEVTLMMQSVTGTVAAADTDATFAAYSLNNPTKQVNTDVTTYKDKLTAVVTASGTGNSGYRVKILQYREQSVGDILDFDNSVTTTFLPSGTTVSPDSTTGTAWTTAGKTVNPYLN